MAYTSKTLIPGKTPIGQNKDGSYIYDGQQNMSIMPAKGTYDASKQMSALPKPIYTPTTALPMTKSPLGFNVMPQVNKEVAQKVNAPVNDILNFRAKIQEDSPRVQQLRQHFRTLEQKGEFQLNKKQTEYIRKFKEKYPDYKNVPDVSLYSKIILAEPKAMEKYGNIGKKGLIESIVGLPLAMAKTGSDAIMEAQDVFSERQKELNQGGNLGLTNLLASASAGRALGTGVMGMAGDVLNVASPLVSQKTGVTSITEGLTRDIGKMVEKVPEEYRQQISDLITKYPKISLTLGTAFDLSNLIPFLGALGKAKGAGEVDDILRQVKARTATRFRGEVSPETFQAGMDRSLVKDVSQIPVKTTETVLKGTSKAGEFAGETAISTGVGISKPSQQAIKTTPELYKQARTGALTRETATNEVVSTLKKRLGELSDTGKEYNTIRQSNVIMPKQDFGKILDGFFKKNDISKVDMPVKDRKVIQQAIDYISEYGDNLTAKNGLSLRRKLDDLADWSSEATGEGKRLIRNLRGEVDKYLGEKIPGLKELDAKYAPEVSFLKKVKTGILNADGTIKDSAISYVANIVGKGKEMKLDRLEELLPGIGQKVRALKAFEEVQAISSMKTGSIMRQLSGVALGNTVLPGFGAIAGFVATNPNIVAFALEKYGMAKKAIKALLKKGSKITPDEAIKVKQAVDAVPSKEVSTFLLGAGEQRKLLMPPKQGDNILTRLSKSDNPTPSSNVSSGTSEASSIQKLLPTPQKPQQNSGKSNVLSQLSKEKSKSAGKKVNNPIIQKLAKKQETPKTPQVEGKTVGFTKKSPGVYEKTIGDREIRVSIGGKDIYPNLKDGEYSVSIHENKLKPDGTWYDPGYGQSGTYGSKEKIMKFLEKEGIDGNEFFQKPSSTPMADGNIGITKKEFIEATRGQHNSIRDIGGIKVARVDFHDGKEWKIVKTDNFDDISPDTRVKGNKKSEKIIAEFETREELMNYLYNKKSLPLSQKSEVKYSKPIEDNLVKEARKYKSAEEFVDNLIFRGEGGKFRPIKVDGRTGMIKTLGGWEGYPMTRDFGVAKTFGRSSIAPEGEVRAFIIDKNAKILDSVAELEKIAGKKIDNISIDSPELLRKAKKMGYDAVDIAKIRPYFQGVGFTKKESEIRILNPNIIKQISEDITDVDLLDIYNKANKK